MHGDGEHLQRPRPDDGLSGRHHRLNRFVYESLYRLDPFSPRAELTPQLATELPLEIDPPTYRVPLRPGAVFHDGSPLSADDIAFTVERIRMLARPCSR